MLLYCLLCGHRNDDSAHQCERCGVTCGAVSWDTLPKGWKRARLLKELVEPIDATFERARFVVAIDINAGTSYAYHTDAFTERIWDSWYPEPPPVPSFEERQLKQSLVDQLHADGWLDCFGGNDQPTYSQFWRRSLIGE